MSFTILFKKIIIWLLVGLRSLLGPAKCKFAKSCTVFAVEVFETKPFFRAFFLVFKRLFYCNPFSNYPPEDIL
jgi:putative component of membrane protein insertase Oxa1/YidC/SpoIIIJ protein YidD